jgi:dihydrofolate reductase
MPQRVILIAAITVDGYVARHSFEITSWSQDLHLFKEQTMGWPIIMGSNTFKTLSKELKGREVVVVHRRDDPKKVIEDIPGDQCFIIGGGKTYYRFRNQLTHIHLTPHPHIFGSGIPLFDGNKKEPLDLKFKQLVEIDRESGIFQFQYKIKK